MITKTDYEKALLSSISDLSEGYWVTLNAICPNEISFNLHLQELANRLNIFCYGNSYRKKSKRLELRGALQRGHAYQKLHAHFVAMKNGQTERSDLEIEEFIRSHWYRLIGAQGNIWGNLVDFQPVNDVASRVRYAIRDFNPVFNQQNQLVYL
jgi:hypothetical protein